MAESVDLVTIFQQEEEIATSAIISAAIEAKEATAISTKEV